MFKHFAENFKNNYLLIHFRSTKALIQNLLENPDIPRPRDLRTRGLFKTTEKTQQAVKHIPLYERFLKKSNKIQNLK